jgi:ArsR family transcriptional regulator
MTALNTVRELKAHYLGLANPTRLEIVSLLAKREMAGSELARKLKLSQPLLSWHLRIMRKASLVDTRRAGREVFCSLNRAGIRHHQERFNQMIKESGQAAAGPPFVPALPEKEIANAV